MGRGDYESSAFVWDGSVNGLLMELMNVCVAEYMHALVYILKL